MTTSTVQALESLAQKILAGELPADQLKPAIAAAGLTGIPPGAVEAINAQIDHSPRLAHALASLAIELARSAPDSGASAQSHLQYVRTLNALGEFRLAAAECGDTTQSFLRLQDFQSAARTWLEAAWAETFLGNLDAAHDYLARARGLAQCRIESGVTARVNWIEGRILRDQGYYAEAEKLFENASRTLSAAGEGLDALRCQRELGHTYARTNPENGLPLLSRLRGMFEQADCPADVALCDYFLGQAYYRLNRYAPAGDHLRAASRRFAENGLGVFGAWCGIDTGILEWRLGHFQEALDILERARADFERSGAESEVSTCDINIALVLIEQNRYPGALLKMSRALEQATSSGRRKKVAVCQENIGLVYDRQGLYAQALNHYMRAREEFEKSEMVERMVLCDLYLGQTYFNLGQHGQALQVLDRAREVAGARALRAYLAECEVERAQVLLAQGRAEEASSGLQQARRLFVETGQPVHVALCDRLLAYLNAQDRATALRLLDESRNVFVRHGQPVDAALCDLARGELRLGWQEWKGAREDLEVAHRVLAPAFPDHAWRADYALGKVALAQKERKTALRRFLNAVDTITNLRASLGLEKLSDDLFGARRQVFADALNLARTEGEAAAALHIIEASKAQTLLTQLVHREWRNQDRADDEEWRELTRREVNARYQLGMLRRRVSFDSAQREGESLRRAGPVEVVPAEMLNELNDLSRAYESIVTRLRLSQRGLAGVESLAPFDPEAFRGMAHARWGVHWAALDYYFSGDELTIGCLSPEANTIENVRLTEVDQAALRKCTGTDPDLRELVYLGLEGGRAASPSDKYLKHLTRKLIPARVLASPDKLTLIVAPHGALHHLPFHALMDGDSYLIDRFAFLYTPSLQTLTQLDRAGDRSTHRSRVLLLGLDEFGARARRLKYSAREVGALQEDWNGQAVALWGEDATRRRILEWNESGKLQEFGLIHMATHAVLEPDAPHWSRIMLDDDDLTVLDIMELQLNAPLVVLSACSSVLGAGGSGDELLGLARAFFYAGARSLVASLWPVEDESTAEFMLHFHRNLKKGKGIADALRGAQLDMRRSGLAPFYWAPFVAVGCV